MAILCGTEMTMEKGRRYVIVVAFVALLLAQICVVAGQSTATLTLSSPTLTVGESGIVEAWLDCGTIRCTAFQIVLQFDPSLLQIDHAELGNYLGASAQEVIFAQNVIDNEIGVIRLAAASLGTPGAPVDALLFRLNITSLASGTAHLNIGSLEVGDMNGLPLEATLLGGVITVQGLDTTTPAIGIVYSVNNVNLREGPGITFPLIAILNPGTVLEVIAGNPSGDWYSVRTEDGNEGWLQSMLVRIESADTLVPTTLPTSMPVATISPHSPANGSPSDEFSSSDVSKHQIMFTNANGLQVLELGTGEVTLANVNIHAYDFDWFPT